ncbi:peptide chain release factor N(5)-glutamine methyltransferase [bacterium]|nr:peptide chain release factor N(5)-glutamine methyltransferase [bacterium]
MNIQELIKILINAGLEENEAKCEIKMLLEHFYNISSKDILLGKELLEEEFNNLKEKVIYRAKTRTPIQYIIGEAWFMENRFKVTQDVLIPRDETEILVRKAIEIIDKNAFEDVLDIGTGSGCIACTIAKKTNATVLGVDISSDALRIALDNVTKLGINNKAVFRKSDLFDKIREGETFDLIISNPPYIPIGTILSEEVKCEPKIALFAEEKGLYFYRKIIEQAPLYLNNGGYLMFELGIDEAEYVKNMMEKDFENIEIIKDLADIDRVIIGKLKI